MFENMNRNLSDTIQVKDSKLKVYLEDHTWAKMRGWCNAATSEVSGMGLCKPIKGGFLVYEVFFPLQYGSSGYTELNDNALAKLQIGLYNKKIPADHFRFWWHTHYNFNVFWSGTDDGNATTLAKANGEWELSLVLNQAGEYRCRVDAFSKPHKWATEKVHILIDEIEVMTCKNAKRHRNKPNYKADIKRWVKPMSELPEKQKPKSVCTPYVMPGAQAEHNYGQSDESWRSSWEYGYNWQDDDAVPVGHGKQLSIWNNESHRWEPEHKKKEEKPEPCKDCKSVLCVGGDICGAADKSKGSEDKPFLRLQDGDQYGRFIFYRGALLHPSVYAKAVEMDLAKAEPNEEDVAVKNELCKCGQTDCHDHDLCMPCDLCTGGRIRVVDYFCVNCYDEMEKRYKGVKRGQESEPTINH